MKKILALLLSILVISTTANSQSETISAHIYKAKIGIKQTESPYWVYQEIEVDLMVYVQSSNIYINNKANTYLSVVKNLSEESNSSYKQHAWACLDEEGKKCVVKLTYRANMKTDNVTLSIEYTDVVVIYYIEFGDAAGRKKYDKNQ